MSPLEIFGLLCFQLLILTNAKSIKNIRETREVEEKRPFSLDDITSDAYFSYDYFNGTWLSENEFYYQVDEELIMFDVTTLESKPFVKFDDLNLVGYSQMSVSPDKNYILIRNNTRHIYRYSTLSTFTIYNVKEKSMKSVQDDKYISIALWTPTSNALIYVLDNDIYYYETKYDTHRQLTNSGKHQTIYNGIPDWVYEEEVLSCDSALWISPNGKHLAFATFNDSAVHETVILRYGEPDDFNFQYPREEKFRYPKSGTHNPQVTLSLIDLSDHGSSAIPLHVPVDVIGTEAILYAVTWFDSKTLVATWTSRVQNESQVVSYSLDGTYHYLLSRSESRGWLLYSNVPPLYYKNNVLLLQPQLTGNKSLGSFSHLTRYRLLNNVLSDEVDLSPSRTWVSSILGVSDLKRAVYFMASPASKPSQKHLYEVSLVDLENSVPKPTCVSCKISTPEGNKCNYVNSVSFSKDLSHYVLTCSGPDAPITNIYDFKHTEVYVWSENKELRSKLEKRWLPKIQNLTIHSHGFDVKVRLYLPHDFDESKKYPLLLNVYGGPESQRITDSFGIGFESYITTARRVVYAMIDGRGSNSRGTAIMYEVYRDLGSGEIADQLYVVGKLRKMFNWIDKNRIGVWGWSYGGYSTAMILTNDVDEIFNCGISVAPVVNWIYYDSIYTERYMGLPTENDNLKKYEESSVLKRVKSFKNKRFMLVHGTGDDNVHFQQSMMLNKLLVEADIVFDQLTYPDEAHHLGGVTSHLYHSMDIFWSKCFGYDADQNPGSNNTVEYHKND